MSLRVKLRTVTALVINAARSHSSNRVEGMPPHGAAARPGDAGCFPWCLYICLLSGISAASYTGWAATEELQICPIAAAIKA